MKGAIETMVGIIIISFMAVLGTSYITVSLNNQKAQNYHSAVVSELEASNYSTEVIDGCKTKAQENGYANLEIDKKVTTDGKPYAKVVLTYKYSIPILNMNDVEQQIVGYAK